MNVCDVLIDVLSEYGVKYIFGIPGDAINELIESIRKQDKIRFIHVMHEESGAFAASAQAKLSGELAVCVGTAGPGAIHLLNGLYDAKIDNAPVLAITGQVETSMLGMYQQQEVNLQHLFADVAVYNQMVLNPEKFPELLRLAIRTAVIERGVSVLSIPADLSAMKVDGYRKEPFRVQQALMQPASRELKEAARLINESKKPCILAGIGAKGASGELTRLAGKINAPIIKALRGKDILPDDHPLVLGGSGQLGTTASVSATKDCDLFLVVGSDFPYGDYYPEDAKMIQIDNNPKHLGRRHFIDAGLAGDAAITLALLISMVDEKEDDTFLRTAQLNKKNWMDKQQNKEEEEKARYIHPQSLARAVSDMCDPTAVICCDTGAVTMWAARHFYIRGQQSFTLSGGLASMAFALPAAIGAKLLYPNRQTIALCGDGGFAMLMCDFATAVKYNLNIKVFVFNNGKLGLIQMEEEAHAGNPESETDLHNPDYAAFAKICGGEGYTVMNFNELAPAIDKALSNGKPTIVDVFINPEELTLPPEISRGEAMNYMKAKVKEFFIK